MNRLEGSSNMLVKFDQKSFIAFLTKTSILHQSDMEEVQRFQLVNSEDDALYHLSDYFERLGDVDPFDNAEKTFGQYKNYLQYGEIVDQNKNIYQRNQNDHQQQSKYFSPSKQSDVFEGKQNSIFDDQQQRGRNSELQNSSRYSYSQQPINQNRSRVQQNGQIHERLYQHAVNKQEYQILMKEVKKEQELKDCTFAPKINPKEKSLLRSQNGSQDRQVFERLSMKKKSSMKESQSSWQKKEELELSQCTFQPQLSKQQKDGAFLNVSGIQSDSQPQDKVFTKLNHKNGERTQTRKVSYKDQTQISNNSSIISISKKNIGSNRSSNQQISQKERDLLEEEQMITPAKLKNKKDFLKWQNWNLQNDDNSDNQTQNSGSQFQQQQIQQQNQNQQFQGYNMQSQPRSVTPVSQYKSASPVSRSKIDDKLLSVTGSDTKQAHERVYDLHFQRQNQQLIKEEESNFMQKKDLTFKPEIYTQNYHQNNQSQQDEQENTKEMFQRLYDKAEIFQQKLQNKRKEKEDEQQEQIKKSHPQINKKSEMIAQHNRLSAEQNPYERLYEVSKQKETNSLQLKSKVSFDEGCTFKPITNQNVPTGIKRDSSNNRKNENNSQQISNENQNLNNFNDQIQNILNKKIISKNTSFNSSVQSQQSQNKNKLQYQKDSVNNEDRHQSHQTSSPDYFQWLLKEKSRQQQAETFAHKQGQQQQYIQINQYENQESNRQFNVQPQSVPNKTSLPFNVKKNNFFA